MFGTLGFGLGLCLGLGLGSGLGSALGLLLGLNILGTGGFTRPILSAGTVSAGDCRKRTLHQACVDRSNVTLYSSVRGFTNHLGLCQTCRKCTHSNINFG